MGTRKQMLKLLALGKGTLPSRLLLMNGARRLTPWSRNGSFWMTLSTTLTPGLPRTTDQRANSSSLLRRWSPPLESSRTSSRRKRSWWITCKLNLQNQPRDSFRIAMQLMYPNYGFGYPLLDYTSRLNKNQLNIIISTTCDHVSYIYPHLLSSTNMRKQFWKSQQCDLKTTNFRRKIFVSLKSPEAFSLFTFL